ncbi:hypothetical protein DTL70_33045 [Streptomyces diacarni]|uniref:Uncharacterized protein n=1 Tax=Streptomyces diacarni TaxID=2800381 RepID=A0A367E897_9ACTN|nr:hypothetical protein DTL70_33045 [Streptomyces diacarni]
MRRDPSVRRAYRDSGTRFLPRQLTLRSPSSPPVRRRALDRCNAAGLARCSRRGRTSQERVVSSLPRPCQM